MTTYTPVNWKNIFEKTSELGYCITFRENETAKIRYLRSIDDFCSRPYWTEELNKAKLFLSDPTFSDTMQEIRDYYNENSNVSSVLLEVVQVTRTTETKVMS